MSSLLSRLKNLPDNINIGLVGIGSIGKGMVLQAGITPGIDGVAIADIIVERAISCAEWLERDYRVVDTLDDMHDAIQGGQLAVCGDGHLIASCDVVNVFVEATNSIPAGGQHAITALEHNKHLVMMNYEADLIFGPYLMHLAQQKDLVYTVCDGDQPTVLKHLIDEMNFMGFELVMAGNIKGYLDRYVNPTIIIPEADKRNLDYRMCASYTDGTKLCVEMAVLANGLGLRTAVPGMYGPRFEAIGDVFEHYDFEAIWADRRPVVDYVLGAKPSGGVFAIGFTDNKYQQDTLAWFPPQMGPGPFYLFYRPYHLGHFETMATIASAALDRKAVLKPDYGFQTNVYAYAKRDLRKGEMLDGIGGYNCYGLIENFEDNDRDENAGIPSCLAENVTLKRDIARDQKILMRDVAYDPEDFAFQLFFKAEATAHGRAG